MVMRLMAVIDDDDDDDDDDDGVIALRVKDEHIEEPTHQSSQ